MAETDNKIKWGPAQIFNATPDEVKKILTVTSIVIGFLITGISASNLISMAAKAELSGWLAAALAALHSFGAMFGVEIKSDTVPTDKVTAVKE